MKVLCILITVAIACSDAFTGSYPGGYPGGNQGYPGGNQGYPGGNQGYPGGNQGYPGGYPGNQGGYPGYPGGNGQMCGNSQCPNNFVCSYQTQTCVARQFTCPSVMISNPYNYKSCQMGCNINQGEQCCRGVCMKGPSLVRSYGNGFSAAEKPKNSPIQSGAEKPKNSPIQSGAGKEEPVPSGGKVPAPLPIEKPE